MAGPGRRVQGLNGLGDHHVAGDFRDAGVFRLIAQVPGVFPERRRLAGDSAQPEGVLRISSADWFACYVLAPVLNELGRRYPLIVPEVIAGHRLFDLARRDADIAFRIVLFTEPDIVHRKLITACSMVYTMIVMWGVTKVFPLNSKAYWVVSCIVFVGILVAGLRFYAPRLRNVL